MSRLDEALESFRRIRSEFETSLVEGEQNEAETRLRLVDRILFEVLGWPRASRVELVVEDDRVDYVLRDQDNRNWVIVEAKRLSVRLASSDGAGKAGNATFKLSGPAFNFGNRDGAWPVFNHQISRYAATQGTALGVATNGEQWVAAAVPSKSGRELKDDVGVVFASFDDIERQFERFYNYLSPSGVQRRILESFLFGSKVWAPLRCEAPDYLVAPDKVRPLAQNPRENFVSELSRALDIAFNPIEDDPNLVEHCFVESRESRDADDRLARLAEHLTDYLDNDPTLLEDEITEGSERLQAQLELAHGGHGTLALLTGEHSSGKTTYLRRFFRHKLGAEMRRNIRYAHVRFDEVTDLDAPADVHRAIARSLEAEVFASDSKPGQFLDLYADVWRSHAALFGDDKGTRREFMQTQKTRQREQPLEYAERLLTHCVRRYRALPCLVFDQFDHIAPQLQNTILQAAVTLHRKCFGVFTVVMDDATAWRLHRSGGLAHLSQQLGLRVWLPRPMIGEVLDNRFAYLRRIFETPQGELRKGRASTTIGRGLRWTLNADEVAAFLRDGLLFGEDGCRRTIARLANHDIRKVLELSRRLILSPQIRKNEVFVKFGTRNSFSISRRQFVRTLIKPNHEHFRATPDHAVVNVLHWSDRDQHVLLGPLIVLAVLEHRHWVDRNHQEDIKGFVRLESLADFVEKTTRIPRALVRRITEWLWTQDLVQSYDPSMLPGAATSDVQLKITPRGQLHEEWARSEWTYVCAMAEVTPICEPSVYRSMSVAHQEMTDHNHERTSREHAADALVGAFLDYLWAPYLKLAPPAESDELSLVRLLDLSEDWRRRLK